jgi:GT2 family glycosyltransferase/glycosyltransferase involved in cell wall biosynthesis
MAESPIVLGNQALQEGRLEEAIKHYRLAARRYPHLAWVMRQNMVRVERKLAAGVGRVNGTAGAVVAVDVVVPVYNARPDVQRCMAALQECKGHFEQRVWLVNDGSKAATTAWLRQYAQQNANTTLLEHATNRGYTCAMNTGLRAGKAPFVVTLNSDTVVTPGWLAGLLACMESEPSVGLVGPVSNAASWQNVPVLLDKQGGFAANPLPQGLGVNEVAAWVAKTAWQEYPQVPLLNGFCIMLKREVLQTVGDLDEVNFPVGYGEENDLCIRAQDAGYKLAVADDVFVYHAKTKSFGQDQRVALSAQGAEKLNSKHGAERVAALVSHMRGLPSLNALRQRLCDDLGPDGQKAPVALMQMKVLFLLPVAGGSGGAHSVVQEVLAMRRLGLVAHVGVRPGKLANFKQQYEQVQGFEDSLVAVDEANLLEVAGHYDVVVGTIWASMASVARVVQAHDHILPAYYVQDYEPLFYEAGTREWQDSSDSYGLVPGAVLFAKTKWLADQVKQRHGLVVHKVQPSIDHEVYRPQPKPASSVLRVVAMIRPKTPRRGAARTMRIFQRLHEQLGADVRFELFGCANHDPGFETLERNFKFEQHGVLTREQVAALLARCDVFVDLSDYQAFGRTALEAMACGCAAVVPQAGGADEYAAHDDNALVLDTQDEEACYQAMLGLLLQPEKVRQLALHGLSTAARYSAHAAAVSEALLFEAQLRHWRLNRLGLGEVFA